MSTILFQRIFYLFLSFHLLPVYASGDWSSGGGKSVVCYDQNRQIISAELLDLYEARVLFGQTNIRSSAADYQTILQIAIQKLQTTGYFMLGTESASERLQAVLDQLVFVLAGDPQLEQINDDFSTVELPPGCIKKQTAIYNRNSILIDQQIWDFLSPLDKAGLLLHEAIYSLERESKNIYDSRRSRRVVALTLDPDTVFEDSRVQDQNTDFICNSLPDPENGDSHLYAFTVNHDNNGNVFLAFGAIDGEMVLSKKLLFIPQYQSSSFRPGTPKEATGFSGTTISSIEDGDVIEFLIQNDKLLIRGKKTSYPERELTTMQFDCFDVF